MAGYHRAKMYRFELRERVYYCAPHYFLLHNHSLRRFQHSVFLLHSIFRDVFAVNRSDHLLYLAPQYSAQHSQGFLSRLVDNGERIKLCDTVLIVTFFTLLKFDCVRIYRVELVMAILYRSETTN